MAPKNSRTVKSSEKLLGLIEELTERGATGVTELADATGLHKSTVHVHLQTMAEHDLVVNDDGTYRLSLEFLTIGQKIRAQRSVYRVGVDEIEALAKETGELACLGVPEDGMATIVDFARGEKAAQTISVGTRIPMDSSPLGRVLLAFGAQPAGDGTDERADAPTGGELEGIREQGYCSSGDRSLDDVPYIAEPEPDSQRSISHRTDVPNTSVAAPVLLDGDPVGAVGVTGSAKRISGDYGDAVRRQVLRTAATIEQKLDVSQ